MLGVFSARISDCCARNRWIAIGIAGLVAAAAAAFAATNFSITTDTEQLLPQNAPWEQHQRSYAAAFPSHQIIAVVDAPTTELASVAAYRLTDRLRQDTRNFTEVLRPQGGEFAERSALLYLSRDRVVAVTRLLEGARSVLGLLAAQPSLAGVAHVLSAGVSLVAQKQLPAGQMTASMNMIAETLEQVFEGKPASMSWLALLDPAMAELAHRRQFIEIDPKLDYNALRPGRAAAEAIREAVHELQLGPRLGATVRLTGRAPINDAQYSALGSDAIPGFVGTVTAVIFILWLALRSPRIIAAVVLTLATGFIVTTTAGLLLIGAFNLLSIAFAVLFVGIGADFAIQYSIRYREERHEHDDIFVALRSGSGKIGLPLALAATGTAIGFFSFAPTEYRGVAELGEIAGIGMLVAFVTTITLLPALLAAFNPPGEPIGMGFRSLAPVDRFLARHRIAVVVGTLVVVVAASPLLAFMSFDFDPTHLQEQNNEAVQTYRELSSAPELGIEAIDVIAPSTASIAAIEQRVSKLPEVASVRSVLDLVPADQDAKLAAIRGAAATLDPVLARSPGAAPSDADTIAALRKAASDLEVLGYNVSGDPSVAALRLSSDLKKLADGSLETRERATAAIVRPLDRDLDRLRAMLKAAPVTVATLPPMLAHDWITADGRARVEIMPKGDVNNAQTMQRFAAAVLSVAPDAAGTPVQLFESERMVLRAFIEAGAIAIVGIGLMLWIALRRFADVVLTLVPLLVAGAVTMELMVVIGEPLNFANVIAFPLLLGVGIAFKIYYVLAWRDGRTNLLQSTLTRAVFFSALTTATAFGSLWLSPQPGMSSMGKLMALALLCTLAAAVLFQPALMGPPRVRTDDAPAKGASEHRGEPPLAARAQRG